MIAFRTIYVSQRFLQKSATLHRSLVSFAIFDILQAVLLCASFIRKMLNRVLDISLVFL